MNEDPKGRKSLFERPPLTPEPPAEEGRRAFYTAPPDGPPPDSVPIHCSRCDVTSHVTRTELARRVMSLTLWAPWRDHSRWITCPACSRRAWCRVSWV